MPFTGLCKHCNDPSFNSMDDAIRIEDGLNRGSFHLAKEADVICIGLNHKRCNSLIPVCVSPTYKKDKVMNETTDTIHALLKAVMEEFYHFGYEEVFGPLSSLTSYGAPDFCQSACQLIQYHIPSDITDYFQDAIFSNTVSSVHGTSMGCDLDHLGKYSRERAKGMLGVTMGHCKFNRIKLATWFWTIGVVKSAGDTVHLLNPDNSMDVQKMVRYLQGVAAAGKCPHKSLPEALQNSPGYWDNFRSICLYGELAGSLAVMIVGHSVGPDNDGAHRSVTEYLCLCNASAFSFKMFFLFRKHRTAFFLA